MSDSEYNACNGWDGAPTQEELLERIADLESPPYLTLTDEPPTVPGWRIAEFKNGDIEPTFFSEASIKRREFWGYRRYAAAPLPLDSISEEAKC